MSSDTTEEQSTYKHVVYATAVTTCLVTVLAYLLPDNYAATGVGLGFMGATYWLVLRRSDQNVRDYGLALGGLLERQPIDWTVLIRDFARAVGWALLVGFVIFPPFVVGFGWWWHPHHPFTWTSPPTGLWDEVLGQVLVIALPEEAFFRGYLQTELDRASDASTEQRLRSDGSNTSPVKGVTVLGARLGMSTPISAAIFAFGHFLTEPNPQRLAVFFPALLFSWLRARTGGIGAGLLLHAMSNILAATLGRGYGLF